MLACEYLDDLSMLITGIDISVAQWVQVLPARNEYVVPALPQDASPGLTYALYP